MINFSWFQDSQIPSSIPLIKSVPTRLLFPPFSQDKVHEFVVAAVKGQDEVSGSRSFNHRRASFLLAFDGFCAPLFLRVEHIRWRHSQYVSAAAMLWWINPLLSSQFLWVVIIIFHTNWLKPNISEPAGSVPTIASVSWSLIRPHPHLPRQWKESSSQRYTRLIGTVLLQAGLGEIQ